MLTRSTIKKLSGPMCQGHIGIVLSKLYYNCYRDWWCWCTLGWCTLGLVRFGEVGFEMCRDINDEMGWLWCWDTVDFIKELLVVCEYKIQYVASFMGWFTDHLCHEMSWLEWQNSWCQLIVWCMWKAFYPVHMWEVKVSTNNQVGCSFNWINRRFNFVKSLRELICLWLMNFIWIVRLSVY